MRTIKLTEKAYTRLQMVHKADKYVGARILSLSDLGWDMIFKGKKYCLGEWWIGKNEDGKYGKMAGGRKNIGSFLHWLLETGPWCFNPIDLSDYVWSEPNQAYVPKYWPEGFRNQPLAVEGHYVFIKDDKREVLLRIIWKRSWLDELEVWSKENHNGNLRPSRPRR